MKVLNISNSSEFTTIIAVTGNDKMMQFSISKVNGMFYDIMVIDKSFVRKATIEEGADVIQSYLNYEREQEVAVTNDTDMDSYINSCEDYDFLVDESSLSGIDDDGNKF